MIVTTLRERLRVDTRAAHDAMDRAFGRFDLASAAGLAAFLAAQREGVEALRLASPEDDPLRPALDAARADLDADLAVLHRAGAPDPRTPPDPDHALARCHIWLASRLGTKMLARRWRAAGDAQVVAAGRYLGGIGERADWRGFGEALDARSGRGREADLVVAAVRGWFSLFEAGAVAARRQLRSDA